MLVTMIIIILKIYNLHNLNIKMTEISISTDDQC